MSDKEESIRSGQLGYAASHAAEVACRVIRQSVTADQMTLIEGIQKMSAVARRHRALAAGETLPRKAAVHLEIATRVDLRIDQLREECRPRSL